MHVTRSNTKREHEFEEMRGEVHRRIEMEKMEGGMMRKNLKKEKK